MRIFIGMQEIAGFFTNLEDGLKRLGQPVHFVNLVDTFKYKDKDETEPRLIKIHRTALLRHHSSTRRQVIFWITSKLWLSVTSILLTLWAITRFDVFIFSLRNSFFRNNIDLPLLKFFGKKIIFVFHGTESRPPYINAARMNTGISIEQAINEAQKMKTDLDRISRFVDAIVSDPPFGHYLTHKAVALTHIGKALSDDIPLLDNVNDLNNNKIRILHTPSKKNVKGTIQIEEVVQSLIDRGYPIEFNVISGVPNIEVKRALNNCDFIIDNLYTDTSIGVVGAEAAQYGKPAIISGYVWDELHRFLPDDRFTPAERCQPDDLENAIIKLVENTEYRQKLGQQAQAWVEENWMPEQVAEKMLMLINNEAPDNWYFDPNDIQYCHGHGLSDKEVRDYISQVIEQGGKQALQLQDKPQLEALVIAFADNKK